MDPDKKDNTGPNNYVSLYIWSRTTGIYVIIWGDSFNYHVWKKSIFQASPGFALTYDQIVMVGTKGGSKYYFYVFVRWNQCCGSRFDINIGACFKVLQPFVYNLKKICFKMVLGGRGGGGGGWPGAHAQNPQYRFKKFRIGIGKSVLKRKTF